MKPESLLGSGFFGTHADEGNASQCAEASGTLIMFPSDNGNGSTASTAFADYLTDTHHM